jgi:hypothetical protein
VLGAALLVCTGIVVDASGAPASPGTNEKTYVDERREDVGAPDITSVIVSNDDSGQITFRLITPNRQRLTRDMRIRIWLTARGEQYFVLVDPFKPEGVTVALYGCEQRPSGMVCAPTAPLSEFRYVRGARFTFDLSDIGIEPAAGTRVPITFWTLIYSGVRYSPATGYDLTGIHQDRAPSRHPRTWTYVAAFGST